MSRRGELFLFILRAVVTKSLGAMNYYCPKKRSILLHAFPDIEDQSVAVMRAYLSDPTEADGELVLMVTSSDALLHLRLRSLLGDEARRVRVVTKVSLAGFWAYLRADIVLITHGIYKSTRLVEGADAWLKKSAFLRWLCRPMPQPKRQTVVALWHGMPLKKVWPGGPPKELRFNYMLATSPVFGDILAQATGLPRSHVRDMGLPRNDLLFLTNERAADVRRRTGVGDHRICVFLPTFRRRNDTVLGGETRLETENPLGMNEAETGRLQEVLKHCDLRLIVKPHPLSITAGTQAQFGERIQVVSDDWLLDRGVTLYELLGISSLLISDVSSVLIDYLPLQRPIICYFPDINEYRISRGFMIEPVENAIPARISTRVEMALEDLQSISAGKDCYKERRARAASIFNPHNGRSCCDALKRLIREIRSAEHGAAA